VLFLHPKGIDFCNVLVTLAAVLGEFLILECSFTYIISLDDFEVKPKRKEGILYDSKVA